MATMVCTRHKAPVPMARVVNEVGAEHEGTAKARCSKCCKVVDCAVCPKCQNTVCVQCYNKAVEGHGKPPRLGPPLGETSSF